MYDQMPHPPFSNGHKGDFPTRKAACQTPLDDEQFIGFRFKDDGYVTMMAEDWASGVFMWPNCKVFSKTPMDHYMKPFQLRLENKKYKSPDLKSIIYQDSCRDDHYDIYEYLKSFLKAYPEKPKFSLTWISCLTHDSQNSLSSAVDYFYQFFNDTKKDFENAFIFFMGDHGISYGAIRETNVGETENYNTFFFLSMPKSLRSTLLLPLKANAHELITHFDIYATLNELVQPKNPRIPNPVIRGSSLLHPLPQPRTCEKLKIPFEFCMCRMKNTILSKENKIGIPAAKLMINRINFELLSSNFTREICAELQLNIKREIIVEDYGGEQLLRVYRITFSILPGEGKFSGIVSHDPKTGEFGIISAKFTRLDSYGETSKCASKSELASYCYCLDQINGTLSESA